DKFANFGIDPRSAWPTCFRLPTPIKPEPLAMPFDDSLRFDDQQSGAPISTESRQGDPKQSIQKTQGRPFSGPVENGQLLAKGEDFRHQFKARRKKGANKGKEKREESHIAVFTRVFRSVVLWGMKTYPIELRQKIVDAVDQQLGTYEEIAEMFGISEQYIYKLLRQ